MLNLNFDDTFAASQKFFMKVIIYGNLYLNFSFIIEILAMCPLNVFNTSFLKLQIVYVTSGLNPCRGEGSSSPSLPGHPCPI